MIKKILLPAMAVILGVLAIFKLPSYLQSQKLNRLVVSGRVEADEVRVSSEIAGRIMEMFIHDGKRVKKGDIIAVIDDERLQSKRKELLYGLEELKERIASAKINIEYLRKKTGHKIEEAKSAIATARAMLRQAESKKLRAENEYRRYSSLLGKGVISPDEFESVELAYRVSIEELNTAKQALKNAEISIKRAEDSKRVIEAEEREVAALERSLDVMKERIRQVDIEIEHTRLKAPSDGVILRKIAEQGEIILPGGVIGILINPENIYVKSFVPESYIGKIGLKMRVEVVSDAYRDRPVHGYICYISDRAEFTPKEVQSYEERVKQVFAVKICFKGEDKEVYEILKKGMPVDVIFPVGG